MFKKLRDWELRNEGREKGRREGREEMFNAVIDFMKSEEVTSEQIDRLRNLLSKP